MLNNKDTYTINEEDEVIINDTTKEKIEVRDIWRYYKDGSTLIHLLNYSWILIEADKTLFSHNGQIEFIRIRRHEDKSTKIDLNNLKCILIEADKTLFSHNDQTEFRYINRFEDKSTLIQLNNDKYILIEADKTLFSHNGETRFRDICSGPEDRGVEIKLNDGYWILIKADGTLFSYNRRTKFRDIRRYSAESTLIQLNNGDWITIKNKPSYVSGINKIKILKMLPKLALIVYCIFLFIFLSKSINKIFSFKNGNSYEKLKFY